MEEESYRSAQREPVIDSRDFRAQFKNLYVYYNVESSAQEGTDLQEGVRSPRLIRSVLYEVSNRVKPEIHLITEGPEREPIDQKAIVQVQTIVKNGVLEEVVINSDRAKIHVAEFGVHPNSEQAIDTITPWNRSVNFTSLYSKSKPKNARPLYLDNESAVVKTSYPNSEKRFPSGIILESFVQDGMLHLELSYQHYREIDTGDDPYHHFIEVVDDPRLGNRINHLAQHLNEAETKSDPELYPIKRIHHRMLKVPRRLTVTQIHELAMNPVYLCDQLIPSAYNSNGDVITWETVSIYSVLGMEIVEVEEGM